MNDKSKIWSDSRDRTDDITHALGGDESADSLVSDMITRRGIILLTNCGNCGRQWKGVVPWGEIVLFVLGKEVPNARATRSGVYLACGCNGCAKTTPVVLKWDEISRYVDDGIRGGFVDPKLRQLMR